jgi:ketosteroid isomerase-like protein
MADFDSKKEEPVAEALIRKRVEDYAKAISAKDIERVMSFFAPNLVSFDIAIKTLRYVGADAKRREWEKVFAVYGSIEYEVRDLNVRTDGKLAFVHGLNHVKGTVAGGHITDLWVRWTACFQQIDGVWLVVHDHASVPVDFEHGQAVLDLAP